MRTEADSCWPSLSLSVLFSSRCRYMFRWPRQDPVGTSGVATLWQQSRSPALAETEPQLHKVHTPVLCTCGQPWKHRTIQVPHEVSGFWHRLTRFGLTPTEPQHNSTQPSQPNPTSTWPPINLSPLTPVQFHHKFFNPSGKPAILNQAFLSLGLGRLGEGLLPLSSPARKNLLCV